MQRVTSRSAGGSRCVLTGSDTELEGPREQEAAAARRADLPQQHPNSLGLFILNLFHLDVI